MKSLALVISLFALSAFGQNYSVMTQGTQSIYGVKFFTNGNLRVSLTPTQAAEAVSKSYVDTLVATGGFTNLFTGVGTTGSVYSVILDTNKFLRGDGTWQEVSIVDTSTVALTATDWSKAASKITTGATLATSGSIAFTAGTTATSLGTIDAGSLTSAVIANTGSITALSTQAVKSISSNGVTNSPTSGNVDISRLITPNIIQCAITNTQTIAAHASNTTLIQYGTATFSRGSITTIGNGFIVPTTGMYWVNANVQGNKGLSANNRLALIWFTNSVSATLRGSDSGGASPNSGDQEVVFDRLIYCESGVTNNFQISTRDVGLTTYPSLSFLNVQGPL